MAISLKELSERIASSMPVGTIIAYYGNDQPSGWLICDGRSCSGTDLSRKLGINNVPDLRGRFIRMIGGNAAGMAVAQGDELKSHGHLIRGAQLGNNGSGYGIDDVRGDGARQYHNSHNQNMDVCVSYGGNETRPVNMAFNYLIKAMGNAKSL